MTDDRLSELLLDWEESVEAGIPLTVDELCRTCPELAEDLRREINGLRAVDRFMYPRTAIGMSTSLFPVVPGYDLLEEIGRGGMGVVYKARQQSLGRFVAIKALAGNRWGQPEYVSRLRQEAKALSVLNHPHIVQVIDVVETLTAVSLVLEYIDGENLARRLNGKPVSPHEAAMFALTLARTLTAVHQQGLLHRDIKPANILIDKSGEIKIADFGLAKEEGSSSSLTLTGDVLGSPSYMAPEQADGRIADIDFRTDIYAIGITLYEMLIGRPPFVGSSTIATLDLVRKGESVAPRLLNPTIPRDLETICLKCLEKEPDRRFATASELAAELQRFLQGEPIRSRPIGLTARVWRWGQRRPALASLIGTSVLASLVILTLLASNYQNLAAYNHDLTQLNEKLRESAKKARELQGIALERERQANDGLYVADIGRAAAAWRHDDTRELVNLIDRHLPRPGEPDRRGFEWHFLRRQALLTHKVLLETSEPLYFLRYSSDDRWIAAAGKDATVRLFDPDSGVLWKEFVTGQIEVNGVAFSPDRTEMATAGDDGTIRIWNLESGRERIAIKAHPYKAFQVHYSPDGTKIYLCGTDPIIRSVDSRTGHEIDRFEGHIHDVQSIFLSDDGQVLISCSSDNTFRRWDLNTGQTTAQFRTSNDVGTAAILPDPNLILIGNDDGLLQTFNVAEGRAVAATSHLDKINSVAVHPNGFFVAAGDGSGQIRLQKISRTGKFLDETYQPWQAHTGAVHSLVWSKDGNRLFSAGDDGRVLSWKLSSVNPTGPKSFVIPAGDEVSLLGNSELLMTSARTTTPVILWNWKTQEQVARGQELKTRTSVVSFDGQYFATCCPEQCLELFRFPTDRHCPLDSKLLASWKPQGSLASASISNDSQFIAISRWLPLPGGESEDHTIWTLDLPGFEHPRQIPIPFAKKVRFAPDSRRLGIIARSGLVIWDIIHEKILWEVQQPGLNHVEFNQDGSLVATDLVNRTVTVRNAYDGTLLWQLSTHRAPIRSIAFSPDGRSLATAAGDGAVKIWHLGTGQEMMEFQNPGVEILKVAFASDSRYLICQARTTSENTIDKILVFDGSDIEP